MNKKPLIASLMILLFLASSLIAYGMPSVSCQSSTTVKTETSTSSPSVGEPFTATISVSDVENLYGLEVILTWDRSVLQAISVDSHVGVESHPDGVLHESSNSPSIFVAENNLTQSEGEYRLTVTAIAPAAAFSGSGNIVQIIFNPLKTGSSPLNLQSELYDYPPTDRDPRVSMAIDHATQSTSITATEASNTTPSQSSTPETSQTPTTASPTANPTSPKPTQTAAPQQNGNLGWEFALIIIAVMTLLVAAATLIVHRRRKME
jgi:hypothetical protein